MPDRRSVLSLDAVEVATPQTREQVRVRFRFRSTRQRRFERLALTLESTTGGLRAKLPAVGHGKKGHEGL
jgi:hypothetical protein